MGRRSPVRILNARPWPWGAGPRPRRHAEFLASPCGHSLLSPLPCLANRFNRSHPRMERASTSRFWPPPPLHPRPPPPNPIGSAPQAYSSCVLGGPGDPLGTQTLSKLTPCWRRSRQGVAVYPAPRKVGPRGSAGQSRPLRPRAPPAPR